MTDEQIKQNAEEYANKVNSFAEDESVYFAAKAGYVSGAHSRDEDIEELKEKLQHRQDLINVLIDELERARNHWISVKDHFPEMFVDSDGTTHNFSVKVLVTNENNPNYWHVAEYYPNKNEWCCLEHPTYIIDNVTHWMPIPDIH